MLEEVLALYIDIHVTLSRLTFGPPWQISFILPSAHHLSI